MSNLIAFPLLSAVPVPEKRGLLKAIEGFVEQVYVVRMVRIDEAFGLFNIDGCVMFRFPKGSGDISVANIEVIVGAESKEETKNGWGNRR